MEASKNLGLDIVLKLLYAKNISIGYYYHKTNDGLEFGCDQK